MFLIGLLEFVSRIKESMFDIGLWRNSNNIISPFLNLDVYYVIYLLLNLCVEEDEISK